MKFLFCLFVKQHEKQKQKKTSDGAEREKERERDRQEREMMLQSVCPARDDLKIDPSRSQETAPPSVNLRS